MNKVDLVRMVDGHNRHGGQVGHGGQYRHGEYAGNFLLLEVARRHFLIDKEDLVGKIQFMCCKNWAKFTLEQIALMGLN